MSAPFDVAVVLADRLVATGAPLVSVILHGSAVLGGRTPGRSDLDLLVVVADDVDEADVRMVTDVLVRFDAVANGMPLEASVVTRRAAATIRDRWPWLAHVNSQDTKSADDALPIPEASDPDLLMHYAVARSAGRAVYGESAPAVIGPVDRPTILRYLAGEMHWGLEHGTAGYALLNACRARRYLSDGAIVSKIDGGMWALHDPGTPQATITAAIAWQRGAPTAPVLDCDSRGYIDATARALAVAADSSE